MAGVHANRIRSGQNGRDLLCRGSSGLYVGSSAAITDNLGNQASGASLAMLQPLASVPALAGGPQRIGIPQLRLQQQTGASKRGLKPLDPPLWDGQAQRWLRQQPSLAEGFWSYGWTELRELKIALLLALLLRGGWMLNRRQQRRLMLQKEQRLNRQLRSQEKALLKLLEPLGSHPVEHTSTEHDHRQAFLRLLPTSSHSQAPASSQPSSSVVERFEQVLRAAHQLALYDQLTGLPNRRYFLERLEREHIQRCRLKQPLALLFIDLDGFKQINDNHGHNAGDRVLQRTAEILTQHLRPGDFVARCGGDEFTLLLGADDRQPNSLDALREQAESVAARLRQAGAADPNSNRITSLLPPIRFSVGLVVVDPLQCSIERLIQRSDQAMYQQKAQRQSAVG